MSANYGDFFSVSADAHFEQFLDSLIANELATGAVSWSDLLAKLPGVTPDIVLDTLRRRQLLPHVDFNSFTEGSKAAPLPVAFRLWGEGKLPTPHLLDACWWFSDLSLAVLTRRIQELAAARVVLLGTPTLWHALRAETSGLDSMVLVDGDAALRTHDRRRQLVTCNILTDQLPTGLEADVVVADPPWYECEMQHFFVAARESCRMDGRVLLSVPPDGTRPGIKAEWERIVLWARELGFELLSYERRALSYLSPPFEHNAFLSAGAIPVRTDWRHGDLATFVRAKRGINLAAATQQADTWIGYSIDGVRFRLRNPSNDLILGVPDLVPLVSGDVLPSVSRRHPLRESVDFWSSGNRVFRCTNRIVMMLILGALKGGTDAVSVVEHKMHRRLCLSEQSQLTRIVAKVRQLIEVEKCENSAFLQGYEQRVDSCPNGWSRQSAR
jgi:hypothetical protein